MAWFSLNPNGNPTQPSNYTLQGSEPTCTGNSQICAVQAENDGNNRPELTEELKDEMIEALHDRASSTNVSLKNP